MTSDADEQQVRDLLGSLERDRAQVSGRRDEILHQVLDHYDRSRQRSDADVVTLQPSSEPRVPRRSVLLWAASIAMIGMLAGLVLLADNRDGSSPADTTPLPSEPVDVLVFADGAVTIDVPDGLSVTQPREGLALVSRDGDGTSVRDAIVIVDDGPRDFGAEMARLNVENTTRTELTGSNVDGRRFDRVSVTLTQKGIDDIDCPPDNDCLELVPGVPETALEPGLRVGAIELVGDDGQTVIVLADEDGPMRTDLVSLLAATTVE